MSPASRVAAGLAIAVLLASVLTSAPGSRVRADNIIYLPEGGRLDAFDDHHAVIGPCPLEHTDVEVEIAGFFTRVTVRQQYQNPYDAKIEAVYTFPLSHRAAVDRMTMTIGDRVIEGKVHERDEARDIYEAARNDGYVAALLEQERPNIFTQSVANIEPGARIDVEISYIEILQVSEGEFHFEFPMVVGPRYIPGTPGAATPLPEGLSERLGVNLLSPAELSIDDADDPGPWGAFTATRLERILASARAIEPPDMDWWNAENAAPDVVCFFTAHYPDGMAEIGSLLSDGTGQVNDRWFHFDRQQARSMGEGAAANTDQVPDASRITPRANVAQVPDGQPQSGRGGANAVASRCLSASRSAGATRAGHTMNLHVWIDTGGPAIRDVTCLSHDVTVGAESAGTVTVDLRNQDEIPNRDFVLTWRQADDEIEESIFTHTSELGNFITLIVQPPARVETGEALPRELIFVLDTSGSMGGEPIEKAKEVIQRALDQLRPQDTFNLITFAGDTSILWDEPRPGTPANRAAAEAFVATREGGGGTEMMRAIDAALRQPESVQAQEVPPLRVVCFLTDGYVGNDMAIIDAVRKNAATTRVFSFGVGNAPNRYLLDEMAVAGRGAAEYVLLEDDADEKVARFVERISTPVLADVEVAFSDNLEILDRQPQQVQDLFDEAPIVIHARFADGVNLTSGSEGEVGVAGAVTITGRSADGPYTATYTIASPERAVPNSVIATLWARAKVGSIMNAALDDAQRGTFPEALRQQVIDLGVTYGIMTPFTSFVAVDTAFVTDATTSQRVDVPVEIPDGMDPAAAGSAQTAQSERSGTTNLQHDSEEPSARTWDEAVAEFNRLTSEGLREGVRHRSSIAMDELVEARQVLEQAIEATDAGEQYAALVAKNLQAARMIARLDCRRSAAQSGLQRSVQNAARSADTRKQAEALLTVARRINAEGDYRGAANLVDQVRALLPDDVAAACLQRELEAVIRIEEWARTKPGAHRGGDSGGMMGGGMMGGGMGGGGTRWYASGSVGGGGTGAATQRTSGALAYFAGASFGGFSISSFSASFWGYSPGGSLPWQVGSGQNVMPGEQWAGENPFEGGDEEDGDADPSMGPVILSTFPRDAASELRDAGLVFGDHPPSADDLAARATLQKLTAFSVNEAPLGAVLRQLADAHSFNLVVDWPQLESAHIEEDCQISLSLPRPVTIETVLQTVLDHVGGTEVQLGFEIHDGLVRVSLRQALDADSYFDVYLVDDLIENRRTQDLSFNDNQLPAVPGSVNSAGASHTGTLSGLVSVIRDSIDPDNWYVYGGPHAITELGGQLIVRQSRRGHAQIRQLLAALRKAVGDAAPPPSVGADAVSTDRFAAELARAALPVGPAPHSLEQQRVMQRLLAPTSLVVDDEELSDVLERIRKLHNVNIVACWQDLAGLGVDRETPVCLNLRRPVPLSRVLDEILRQFSDYAEVVYDVRDGVIRIAGRDYFNDCAFTELYPVSDLLRQVRSTAASWNEPNPIANAPGTKLERLSRCHAVDELLEMVRAMVTPDDWRENGGQAAIQELGGQLIVNHRAQGHAELRQLLLRLRAARQATSTAAPSAGSEQLGMPAPLPPLGRPEPSGLPGPHEGAEK